MKRQLSQPNKWLLTTALLAVLGTNYSLQTSSIEVARLQETGQFELALTAPELTPDGSVRIAPNMSVANKSEKVKSEKEASDITLTEAVSSLLPESCESGDCKNVPASADILLKLVAENKELMSKIQELEAKTVVKTEEAKSEPEVLTAQDRLQELRAECNSTEDGEKESSSDRRERIKCEKEAIKTVKEEKASEQQEAREEKFEEAVAKIQEKCEGDNLKCLTEKFSSLLNKFKGKKSLSQAFVSQQFKDVIGPELSKSLFNEKVSPEEMHSILGELFNDFPSEYSNIQKATLSAIQKMAVEKAKTVTAGYKTAELMSKQNNPAAYLQKLNEVQTEQQSLETMTNSYTASFLSSDAYNNNIEMSTYYKKSYLPTIQETFAKILSPATTTAVTADGQIVSEKVTAIIEGKETSTRTNHRGGGSSVGVNLLNQQKLSPSEQSLIPQPGSRGGATRGGASTTGSQLPGSMPPPPPTSYMQFNL